MAHDELTRKDIEAVFSLEQHRREEADELESLTAIVLSKIRGGVWHTTNSQRYQAILRTGSILPEPEISNSDRWGATMGINHYPYVRSLGGVSLFDFREFDPEGYSNAYPLSSWREFVPYRTEWGEAVWIEIDVSRVGSGFISGAGLLARWKTEQSRNRFMPLIEAAHIGALPQNAFKQVFTVRKWNTSFLLEPV